MKNGNIWVVTWICQNWYMDFSKLLHGFVKVARWICKSCFVDLSELFYVFLALCQTKPHHEVWINESEPGSWLDSLFHKRHATIVLTVDTYFCTIKTLHWVWNILLMKDICINKYSAKNKLECQKDIVLEMTFCAK